MKRRFEELLVLPPRSRTMGLLLRCPGVTDSPFVLTSVLTERFKKSLLTNQCIVPFKIMIGLNTGGKDKHRFCFSLLKRCFLFQ